MVTLASKNTPILRHNLIPPATLMHDFANIRNTLAGQAHGMTLDHELVDQLATLLLIKIYDEQNTMPSKSTRFQLLPGEKPLSLAREDQWHFQSTPS